MRNTLSSFFLIFQHHLLPCHGGLKVRCLVWSCVEILYYILSYCFLTDVSTINSHRDRIYTLSQVVQAPYFLNKGSDEDMCYEMLWNNP